ncbi:MAG: hypothetical protein ABI972_29375, partial [Acidobacteriota bacterium]
RDEGSPGYRYNLPLRALLIVMAAVAASFAGVIAGGFWLRPRMVDVPDSVFGLAAALILFGVPSLVAWCLIRTNRATGRAGGRQGRGRGHRKGVYGLMDCSMPEQIAYRQNPQATATCPHLRSIEEAMRTNAAIEVDLLRPLRDGPAIRATCRVDEKALRGAFGPAVAIRYHEEYYSDRGNDRIPTAHLICTECREAHRAGSAIWVLHPDECYADTPWFPARAPR